MSLSILRGQSGHRVDKQPVNFLRALGGDLFDIHAAFPAGHQADATAAAVDHQAGVKLGFDIDTLLDQQPSHDLAFGTSLRRNQRHTQYFGSELFHFVERPRHFHAAALAAPTGVDLRFNHPRATAQAFGRLHRFVNAKTRDFPVGVGTPNSRKIFLA